jgi:AMP nucleosidase
LFLPHPIEPQEFSDAAEAVAALEAIYDRNTRFLCEAFQSLATEKPKGRYRAFYPQVSLETTSFGMVDSRLSYGHVVSPGHYATTVTRPSLYRSYLTTQFELLLRNHGTPLTVSESDTPIPLHSLAPFTAQRIDYSLARLSHYTATLPEHFQNHVLFTNYQFYMDEFVTFARAALADPDSGYARWSGRAIDVITNPDQPAEPPSKLPQMPTYHLTRERGAGITLVNIGVGPSNAKTATDHIAVLRPHVWLMVGHCAGLRNTQSLGDYVLAHAYLREDRVLDDDLPVWVPIPALAEVQIALEEAVADVAEVSGYDLKRIMRTGTVATVDNRNWELRDQAGPVQRLSQSRAIALDMESATIAASPNGFRFRVPLRHASVRLGQAAARLN